MENVEYRESFKYPTCVCLNLTDNCNLACKYCFVQQKPHYMTLDIAKDAIDYLVNNYYKKKELEPNDEINGVDVTFFGGEPTLLWDQIIVPIVAYSEEKYPDIVHFNITTNGTLLNDERIDFLKEHNIPLLLSIDGDEYVQNFNRPQRNGEGSFELVRKNIPKILQEFRGTTFRSTIYQPTCGELYNTYKFAEKMGFRHIFMCPNAREEWTEENLEILHQEIHKIVTHFIMSCMEKRLPISCAALENAFQKILQHDLQVYNNYTQELNLNRSILRCGIGTGSASIGYDGKIFGCQEQDSRDTNDFFYLGDIYQGIDVERHKQLLGAYHKKAIMTCEDNSLCNNCSLRSTCIDDVCPSVSYDMFKDFHIKPRVDCLYHQWFLEDAIVAMDFLVKHENNETFKQYLNNIYSSYEKEGK